MAGLVPAIHALPPPQQGVDARLRGHDEQLGATSQNKAIRENLNDFIIRISPAPPQPRPTRPVASRRVIVLDRPRSFPRKRTSDPCRRRAPTHAATRHIP